MNRMVIIPFAAVDDARLTDRELRLLAMLHAHQDRATRQCRIPLKVLAGKCHLDQISTAQHIRRLNEKGWVSTVMAPGKAKSYTLHETPWGEPEAPGGAA